MACHLGGRTIQNKQRFFGLRICYYIHQVLFHMEYTYIYIYGWWYTYPSEKYEFVSWDDEIPNMMESHKSHVPNHQPDINGIYWIYI